MELDFKVQSRFCGYKAFYTLLSILHSLSQVTTIQVKGHTNTVSCNSVADSNN